MIINPGTLITSGTAILDFGNLPGSNEASVAVTGQSRILASSKVIVYIKANSTSTDHTENDHKYAPIFIKLTSGAITPGVGFTIYGVSEHKITGDWEISYSWY